MGLEEMPLPKVNDSFGRIRDHIGYIEQKKTAGMFKKVNVCLGQGSASFVDAHTVQVDGKKYSGKTIFIATGTHPMIPPIPGLKEIDYLTNETIFNLESVPKSLTIIGGGAIGCEMAQAFSRLGAVCSIVQVDEHLMPQGDAKAAQLLEDVFQKENISVFNSCKITKVEKCAEGIVLITDKNEKIIAEKLLVAAGRKIDVSELDLEKARVELSPRGAIQVNRNLQTSRKNIYAVGDCNGEMLFSHAAMHQGMLALMNAVMVKPIRFNFKNYVTPWTVFTEPQFSQVGMTERQLKAKKISYETIMVKYENYGAAIAENVGIGFVKVFVSKLGRIYGAVIIGEGSGEMINEWALAIQKKCRLTDILFLQHSFPTMGFLTKRISEKWMMKKMESKFLRKVCRFLFWL